MNDRNMFVTRKKTTNYAEKMDEKKIGLGTALVKGISDEMLTGMTNSTFLYIPMAMTYMKVRNFISKNDAIKICIELSGLYSSLNKTMRIERAKKAVAVILEILVNDFDFEFNNLEEMEKRLNRYTIPGFYWYISGAIYSCISEVTIIGNKLYRSNWHGDRMLSSCGLYVYDLEKNLEDKTIPIRSLSDLKFCEKLVTTNGNILKQIGNNIILHRLGEEFFYDVNTKTNIVKIVNMDYKGQIISKQSEYMVGNYNNNISIYEHGKIKKIYKIDKSEDVLVKDNKIYVVSKSDKYGFLYPTFTKPYEVTLTGEKKAASSRFLKQYLWIVIRECIYRYTNYNTSISYDNFEEDGFDADYLEEITPDRISINFIVEKLDYLVKYPENRLNGGYLNFVKVLSIVKKYVSANKDITDILYMLVSYGAMLSLVNGRNFSSYWSESISKLDNEEDKDTNLEYFIKNCGKEEITKKLKDISIEVLKEHLDEKALEYMLGKCYEPSLGYFEIASGSEADEEYPNVDIDAVAICDAVSVGSSRIKKDNVNSFGGCVSKNVLNNEYIIQYKKILSSSDITAIANYFGLSKEKYVFLLQTE